MSVMSLSSNRMPPAAIAGFLVAAGAAATILGAVYFQYVVGLQPCPMCYEERIPHYIAIPLALVVAIAALRGAPRNVVRAGLAVIAIAMLILVGMSIYHAGVEWKWWPGPTECTGAFDLKWGEGGVVDTPVIRCDEASFRFLGLSFAGWDALVSAFLTGVALWGAAQRR